MINKQNHDNFRSQFLINFFTTDLIFLLLLLYVYHYFLIISFNFLLKNAR